VSFAVLVVPYAVELDGEVSYALFRAARCGEPSWHALSGDGARRETPLDAARRVAWQVAQVPRDAAYLTLDSRATIRPGEMSLGVPEHAFAVRVFPDEVRPQPGQFKHCWVSYEIADGLVACDADRNALWELRRRLGRPARCG
jgi:dATP pyrophosphohydrolase